MNQVFKISRITLLSALIILISLLNAKSQEDLEDVIYLKNGSVLHGHITEIKVNESITLKSNCNDIWVINQDDIDQIKKEKVIIENKIGLAKQSFDFKRKGFYSNINVGFLFGGDMETPFPPLSLMFASGYQFISGLAIGGGLGLELLTEAYMPLVIDIRYTYRNTRLSHFIYMQGGYAFSIENPDPYDYNYYSYYESDLKSKGGYLINPGIGFKLNLNEKNAISFGIGYKHMKVKHTYNEYNGQEIERTITYNRVVLSFGYHF